MLIRWVIAQTKEINLDSIIIEIHSVTFLENKLLEHFQFLIFNPKKNNLLQTNLKHFSLLMAFSNQIKIHN